MNSLVAHPGEQNLTPVLKKISALNAKSGPFGKVVLVGDILPKDTADIQAIPTIENAEVVFTSGSGDVGYPDNVVQQLSSKNLHHLAGFGVLNTVDEVAIGYLGGKADAVQAEEFFTGKKLDILISYKWPETIANEHKLFFGDSTVDTVAKMTQPLYHFAVGSEDGSFFERKPFHWSDSKRITRFISLNKFNDNPSKLGKWIYAFNFDKATVNDLAKLPSDHSNPFEVVPEPVPAGDDSKKRKFQPDDELLNKITKRKNQIQNFRIEDCFFCLSSPKAKLHMIITIGELFYLTIAKGPLTRPTETMPFSGHCLLIPIEHTSRLIQAQDTPGTQKLTETDKYKEMMRFENSLVKMFASFGLSTVFFYYDKENSIHFHVQVFPIATSYLDRFEEVLERNMSFNNEKYESFNTKLNFKKSSLDEFEDLVNDASHHEYGVFKIYNESTNECTIYSSTIDQTNSNLDVIFGRRVLAFLLKMGKRVKWDRCLQTEQKESLEAELFKDSFKLI